MEPKELISKVGSAMRLSRAVGHRSHSTVLKWRSIPPHHCPTIERIFGIPREELRPDLFKRTPAQEAER